MITPPLGPEVDTSQQRCSFSTSVDGQSTCSIPATWHILWDGRLENGLACSEHMPTAQQFAYLDRHPVGTDCAMPGSSWCPKEKRCVIDDSTLFTRRTLSKEVTA